MTTTKTDGLYTPDFWADAAKAEIAKKLILTSLAVVRDDLVGRPGDTVQMPKFNALTELTETTEGVALVPEALTQSKTSAKIKGFGKAVEITDEAQLTGTGNAQDEALSQFAELTAQKIDSEMLAAAVEVVAGGVEQADGGAATDSKPLVSYAGAGNQFSYEGIVDATSQAGDQFNPADWVALVNNADRARAMKSDVFIKAAQGNGENGAVNKGELGDLAGVTLRVSNAVPNGQTILVKKNSIALFWKKRPLVEHDRDILTRTDVFATTLHFAAARVNDKGVIQVFWNADAPAV